MDTQAAKKYILERLRTELPAERTYHCLEHTLDVYASVIDIAEQEGVSGEGLELLKIAALYHDAGFIEKDSEHESTGCKIARQVLPGFGFQDEQVELICEMIMSTRIPQSPGNKLSRILCDADLDYLGRNDFERIGETLYEEMLTYGTLSNRKEWNELQISFLDRHRYFTDTNKRLREPMKQRHLEQCRASIAKSKE